MLYTERRGFHEVEHWTRDEQLLLVASHKCSYVTVRRESSAPLRGHLCALGLFFCIPFFPGSIHFERILKKLLWR